MSVESSDATCVLCDEPVLTDDTDNAVTVDGPHEWAHRACVERDEYKPCENCGTYSAALTRISGLGDDPLCTTCTKRLMARRWGKEWVP